MIIICLFLLRVSNLLLNTRRNHRLAHPFNQILHSIQVVLYLHGLVVRLGEFSINLRLCAIDDLADVLLCFRDTFIDELMQVGGLGADAQ